MEGNDTFYVLSTNPTVETSLYGGMGSDRVEVGARGVPVQSDDLQGHTGLVRHSVESSGGLTSKWRGVPVDGVAAEIQDNDAPAITVVPVGGSLVLREATSNVGQLRVRPTYKSNTQVEVTLSAPYDPSSTSRSQSVLLSLDGVHWSTSVTLVFGVGSTTAQLVYVKAAFDNSSEGRRQVPLQTRVVGRLSGTGAQAGSVLTKTGAFSAFATNALVGGQVVLTGGPGAGQTRTIVASTANTLTLDSAWTVAPTTASTWQVRGVGAYDGLIVANPVVTVLDDDQVGVDVVLPDGGIRVTEPVASGSDKGRTVATYTVGLSRVPNGTVTVHLLPPPASCCSGSRAPRSGSARWTSPFTATNWSTPVTIEVTGRYDGKVEGQHAGRIDTTVTGGDELRRPGHRRHRARRRVRGRRHAVHARDAARLPGAHRRRHRRRPGALHLEQHRERHHGRGGLGRPAGQHQRLPDHRLHLAGRPRPGRRHRRLRRARTAPR